MRKRKRTICRVNGCNKPVKARDLCDNHYKIKQRSGELKTGTYQKREGVCSVEGCEKKIYAKGLCNIHYQRYKRYGTTSDEVLFSKTRSLTLEERLKYYGTGTNEKGCILWEGPVSDGYGALWWKNYPLRAHRVSHELYNGKIPKGYFVCHHCDEKLCVNPDHLYAGTPKDNVRDAIERGLFPKAQIGGNSPGSKLTEKQAKEIIKRKGQDVHKLAKHYGVSYWSIYDIWRGRSWKHLER